MHRHATLHAERRIGPSRTECQLGRELGRRGHRGRIGHHVRTLTGLRGGLLHARQGGLDPLAAGEDVQLSALFEAQVLDGQATEQVVDDARGDATCRFLLRVHRLWRHERLFMNSAACSRGHHR